MVDSVTSVMGGAVSISADGSFSYLPPVGIVNASDSFEYQVFDGFESTIGTVTVVIANTELVWYVDNSTAVTGDGRNPQPFKSLLEAESASVAGNVIFVFEGNGTSSDMDVGIVLKDNQRLLGETAGLILSGMQVIPAPTTPRSPVLTNTAGDGITLAANSIVRGLVVEDTTGMGITGVDIVDVEIRDVRVRRTQGDAIDIKAAPSASSTLVIADVVVEGNGNDFTTVPIGIDIDVNGTGGGQLLSTITNTQINGVVIGLKLRARGNTGTGPLGANLFVVTMLNIDRVNDDAVELDVDGMSINTFSFINVTIDGQDGVNMATPNRGFDVRYRAGTGSATSLSIVNSTITNFSQIGVDLQATGSNNAGTLTALVRDNNISNCARALSLSPDDEVTFVATIDNNTMTGNESRTSFGFGTGTTHRIELNLLNNEDDKGFNLTRHDVGVLTLGGDIGQGSSFDDDNGNIEDRGNTTNNAAPNVNIQTAGGGAPLQINIVNDATIAEP